MLKNNNNNKLELVILVYNPTHAYVWTYFGMSNVVIELLLFC